MAISTRPRRQQAGGSSRVRTQRKSYREISTSEESESDNDSQALPSNRTRLTRHTEEPRPTSEAVQPNPRKRKAAPTRFPQSRNKKAKIRGGDTTRQSEEADDIVLKGGKIPAWHTLPYHILVQVFEYAARPLFEDYLTPSPSIRWILQAARACKTFTEPAISVLYYAPPLLPPSRARGLLAHLQGQSNQSLFNYRAKVKYLDIDGYSVLHRKHQGQDPIDIRELLAILPKLRGMGIHRVSDIPKFNKLSQASNTSKSIQVLRHTISALQERKPPLQEWKWSALASDWRDTFNLSKIHRTLPFQNLRTLTLVGFGTKTGNEKGPGKSEEELGKAICALPNLLHLQLILCNDVNAKLLPLLPKSLQDLEIIDCPIDSKMLRPFLASHGNNLHRLVLDHNQSLNLAFLRELKKSCPVLEFLKMDLTYYNSHYTFTDIEPRFEALLPSGQVPSWPATLQHLELIHLRKWDNDLANDFFTSLVDSAGDLPKLQRLIIKASLSESGWRERINFRDRWIARLQKVFLRKAEPPSPHLRSIAAFKTEKARNPKGLTDKKEIPRDPSKILAQIPPIERPLPEEPPSRLKRNLRRGATEANGSVNHIISDSTSDSDAPLLTKRRRSSRLAHDDSEAYTSQPTPLRRPRRRRRAKNSDEDSSSEEDSALEEDIFSQPRNNGSQTSLDLDGNEALVIQGKCDVVRIQIDNLRPTEEQLVEDDFIDEELSGDGDWNGDDDGDERDGYAW